jgi:CheY-like chemotaxis protein
MHILLIEDDQIEIMKFKRIVSELSEHDFYTLPNGEKALEYLNETQTLPELILLDLNMPKMNGLEFLELLKKDQQFFHIPVVILTTSDNNADILASYRSGIAGYVTKPLKYEDYKTRLHRIIDYWAINQLPKTNLI